MDALYLGLPTLRSCLVELVLPLLLVPVLDMAVSPASVARLSALVQVDKARSRVAACGGAFQIQLILTEVVFHIDEVAIDLDVHADAGLDGVLASVGVAVNPVRHNVATAVAEMTLSRALDVSAGGAGAVMDHAIRSTASSSGDVVVPQMRTALSEM
ncbi:hypothetical protein [Leifsonia shinshuensis]|uniref:Uncharacterized protein n=1 Tax=Leifsonia shinshuensis TaxID=150026 RepID=A0A853CWZ6_9MICO|nr:hypothetical protein [Leifsonia shinshuensis]NYJ23085.1 hypothetical protein [Leifsonia shinshuensis]